MLQKMTSWKKTPNSFMCFCWKKYSQTVFSTLKMISVIVESFQKLEVQASFKHQKVRVNCS